MLSNPSANPCAAERVYHTMRRNHHNSILCYDSAQEYIRGMRLSLAAKSYDPARWCMAERREKDARYQTRQRYFAYLQL